MNNSNQVVKSSLTLSETIERLKESSNGLRNLLLGAAAINDRLNKSGEPEQEQKPPINSELTMVEELNHELDCMDKLQSHIQNQIDIALKTIG